MATSMQVEELRGRQLPLVQIHGARRKMWVSGKGVHTIEKVHAVTMGTDSRLVLSPWSWLNENLHGHYRYCDENGIRAPEPPVVGR